MKTIVYKTDTPAELHQAVEAAARLLRQGQLVAIPTETVYGLAANALDAQAVGAIFEAKGRPNDNPLIVHIADMEALPQVAARVPEKARLLMERFWPGPLTIILPRTPQVPDATTAGLDTVAVRMPSHPVAQAIIRLSGLPIAAPSANLSGSPSPTEVQHCIDDLTGRVPAIVDGGSCTFGVESTVITLAGEQPRLLRPGAVTLEEMQQLIGPIRVDPAVTQQLQAGAVAASPGMKYKHYSPKARVYLVRGSYQGFCSYVNALEGEGVYAMVFDGEQQGLQKPAFAYGAQQDHLRQAQELFRLLREFDHLGAREVYVRCPDADGVGLAVYNRLIRAAAFTFIDLD